MSDDPGDEVEEWVTDGGDVVRELRRHTLDALSRWSAPSSTICDAVVCIDRLASDIAGRRAATATGLRIARFGSYVRVLLCEDLGPHDVASSAHNFAAVLAEQLVGVAERWGVTRDQGRSTAWFELTLGPGEGPLGRSEWQRDKARSVVERLERPATVAAHPLRLAVSPTAALRRTADVLDEAGGSGSGSGSADTGRAHDGRAEFADPAATRPTTRPQSARPEPAQRAGVGARAGQADTDRTQDARAATGRSAAARDETTRPDTVTSHTERTDKIQPDTVRASTPTAATQGSGGGVPAALASGAGAHPHAPEPDTDTGHRLAANTLTAGELRIDLITRSVHVGDQAEPVRLTGREFELLVHLVRRAGHIQSRRELLRDVWRIDFAADTAVVEVTMSRLRRKLGARDLRTVKDAGYVFGTARHPAGAPHPPEGHRSPEPPRWQVRRA